MKHFTQKHFIDLSGFIAENIKNEDMTKTELINKLSVYFSSLNPKFKPELFKKKCYKETKIKGLKEFKQIMVKLESA